MYFTHKKIIRTKKDLIEAMTVRQSGPPKLGKRLFGLGLISANALDAALHAQAAGHRGRIGEILVGMGAISRESLEEVLDSETGVFELNLAEYPTNEEAKRLLPFAAVQMYKGMPVDVVDGSIVVAFGGRPSQEQVAALRFASGCPVFPVKVSDPLTFANILAKNYPTAEATKLRHGNVRPDRYEVLSASGGTAAGTFRSLTAVAISRGASDMHFRPTEQGGTQVLIRLDGSMLEVAMLKKEVFTRLLRHLEVLAGIDYSKRTSNREGRLSFEHEGRPIDLRLSVIAGIYGDSAVIRILDPLMLPSSLAELELPYELLTALSSVLDKPSGLLLVAGPTGSGKSTTQLALVKELATRGLNVVTIEDPVEYKIQGVNQFEGNPETLLPQILRHDPDVIMVGEIRSPVTMSLALNAALTGHLILSTIHTSDAATAVSRLVGLGAPPATLGSALLGVINQRLVRAGCHSCGGRGCPLCSGTGFKGRRLVAELSLPKLSFSEITSHPSYAETAAHFECVSGLTIEKSLAKLVKSNITPWQEAKRLLPKRNG